MSSETDRPARTGRARHSPAASAIVVLGLISMLAMGLTSGCVSSDGTDGTGSGGSADGGNGDGGNNGNGGGKNGNGGNGGNGGDDGFGWVPFGPNDPTIPAPSWPVYNAFAQGECADLAQELST